MPIEITVADTIAGLEALALRCQVAGYLATTDALVVIRDYARDFAPVGVEGNTTNPPGTLKEHESITGPVGGGTRWTGRVGPTVVSKNARAVNYGRQREFGGGILGRPPKFLKFTKFGQWLNPTAVYQEGSHFLLRARLASGPKITERVIVRFTEAVEA